MPPPTSVEKQSLESLQEQYQSYGQGRQMAADQAAEVANMDVFRGIREKIGQGLADGGDEAGRRIVDSGKEGGDYFASAVSSAIREAAAAAAATIRQAIAGAAGSRNGGSVVGVNADTGRTMPPEAGRPKGGGW